MIQLVNPEKILPIHGEKKKMDAFVELGKELGFTPDKKLLLLKSGDFYTLIE